MNGLLLAPILSFFSTRLYRAGLQSGMGRGFLYLFYLTILFSLLVVFLCQFLLLPVTATFMDWLVQVTPEVTVTQAGLNVDAQQPYLVKHPTFGPLYLIDTTKDTAQLIADSNQIPILIGREDVIINDPNRGGRRTISLREAMLKSHEANQPIRITKNIMRDLSKQLQRMVIPFVLLFLAPFFFIWKLLAALFYSLFALFFNLFRKEKFRYGGLFTLACYAISPITIIQAVRLTVPDAHLNLNLGIAFALTLTYLLFGMFVASPRQH
jgi:hypothetical protein